MKSKMKNGLVAAAALAAITSGTAAPALAATHTAKPVVKTVTAPKAQTQAHAYVHFTSPRDTKAQAQAEMQAFVSKVQGSKGVYTLTETPFVVLGANGWQGEVDYRTAAAPLSSSDIDTTTSRTTTIPVATGTHMVQSIGTEKEAENHLAWAVNVIKSHPNDYQLLDDGSGSATHVFKNMDGKYGYSVTYQTSKGSAFKGDSVYIVE